MPDTRQPDYRIGQLEQQMARVEQRVDDLSQDVRAFAPLLADHAEMRANINFLVTRTGTLEKKLDRIEEAASNATTTAERDAKGRRLTVYVALLAAFVSLFSSGVGALLILTQ